MLTLLAFHLLSQQCATTLSKSSEVFKKERLDQQSFGGLRRSSPSGPNTLLHWAYNFPLQMTKSFQLWDPAENVYWDPDESEWWYPLRQCFYYVVSLFPDLILHIVSSVTESETEVSDPHCEGDPAYNQGNSSTLNAHTFHTCDKTNAQTRNGLACTHKLEKKRIRPLNRADYLGGNLSSDVPSSNLLPEQLASLQDFTVPKEFITFTPMQKRLLRSRTQTEFEVESKSSFLPSRIFWYKRWNICRLRPMIMKIKVGGYVGGTAENLTIVRDESNFQTRPGSGIYINNPFHDDGNEKGMQIWLQNSNLPASKATQDWPLRLVIGGIRLYIHNALKVAFQQDTGCDALELPDLSNRIFFDISGSILLDDREIELREHTSLRQSLQVFFEAAEQRTGLYHKLYDQLCVALMDSDKKLGGYYSHAAPILNIIDSLERTNQAELALLESLICTVHLTTEDFAIMPYPEDEETQSTHADAHSNRYYTVFCPCDSSHSRAVFGNECIIMAAIDNVPRIIFVETGETMDSTAASPLRLPIKGDLLRVSYYTRAPCTETTHKLSFHNSAKSGDPGKPIHKLRPVPNKGDLLQCVCSVHEQSYYSELQRLLGTRYCPVAV